MQRIYLEVRVDNNTEFLVLNSSSACLTVFLLVPYFHCGSLYFAFIME